MWKSSYTYRVSRKPQGKYNQVKSPHISSLKAVRAVCLWQYLQTKHILRMTDHLPYRPHKASGAFDMTQIWGNSLYYSSHPQPQIHCIYMGIRTVISYFLNCLCRIYTLKTEVRRFFSPCFTVKSENSKLPPAQSL